MDIFSYLGVKGLKIQLENNSVCLLERKTLTLNAPLIRVPSCREDSKCD